MARILICEPHADIRSLLSFVVRRVGHEPVVSDGSQAQLSEVDVLVLEPGSEEALALAGWARAQVPALAIVCVSIFPPGPETDALRPDAYLLKPFPLYQLENALAAALTRPAAHLA